MVPSASVASPQGCPSAADSRCGQAVLLGPGLSPLVRADEAGSVTGDSDAAEESASRAARAVRPLVLLLERPERLLAVGAEDALECPGLKRLGGVLILIPAAGRDRQVDLNHVEGRPLQQLLAHRRIDHVVGRRDHVAERGNRTERVVEGAEGADFGHAAQMYLARCRI
jgi:hypothetical protein